MPNSFSSMIWEARIVVYQFLGWRGYRSGPKDPIPNSEPTALSILKPRYARMA